MKLGLKPIAFKDWRTYDFHRTFGTATLAPAEFNFDVNRIFPDQNRDGRPMACTAYTVNDSASNEDGLYYDDIDFTYGNTKMMAGVSGQVPVSVTTALKSATVYGVKQKEQTQEDALRNRRAPYFIVKRNPDFFDGLVSAMLVKKGTLVIGTPWLSLFNSVGKNGLVPDFTAPQNFTNGHCWEACGVKQIGGEARIICKPWLGQNIGDGGYLYFNRKQINDLLDVKGSGAFGQKDADPADIEKVQMTILETIVSYLRFWMLKLTETPSLPPTPAPVPPQREPEPIGERIYKEATRWLGKDASPTNKAPQELACAESVCSILQKAGIDIPLLVSTIELKKWLTASERFKASLEAKPGNIIISVTGTGNGSIPGHVGIFGLNETIMSNESVSGLWRPNYTLRTWIARWRDWGGMKIYYFEPIN